VGLFLTEKHLLLSSWKGVSIAPTEFFALFRDIFVFSADGSSLSCPFLACVNGLLVLCRNPLSLPLALESVYTLREFIFSHWSFVPATYAPLMYTGSLD
jgi:hypothetical protein